MQHSSDSQGPIKVDVVQSVAHRISVNDPDNLFLPGKLIKYASSPHTAEGEAHDPFWVVQYPGNGWVQLDSFNKKHRFWWRIEGVVWNHTL